MPKKSDKKMRDDKNYARLNAHLARAVQREKKLGVRCWGDGAILETFNAAG